MAHPAPLVLLWSILGFLLLTTDAVTPFSQSISCVNKNDCLSFDCSERDAAFRAGHLCHEFPWYNGGYPMRSLPWDNDNEYYDCTTFNSSFCAAWTTREVSGDETETGSCSCNGGDPSNRFCQEWVCEQLESNLCKDGEQLSGDQCCGTDSDGYGYCYHYEREIEITTCSCRQASGNGEFCYDWHCVETDDNGPVSAENEDYKCTLTSANGLYCAEWEGSVDSLEEFEFSRCQCIAPHTSGQCCSKWTCFEKGLSYNNPNLAIIALSAIPGAIGLSWFLYVIYSPRAALDLSCCGKCCSLGFSLCWMGGCLVLGTYLAGIVVFLFTLGLWFLIGCAVDLYQCLRPEPATSCFYAIAELICMPFKALRSRSSHATHPYPTQPPPAYADRTPAEIEALELSQTVETQAPPPYNPDSAFPPIIKPHAVVERM